MFLHRIFPPIQSQLGCVTSGWVPGLLSCKIIKSVGVCGMGGSHLWIIMLQFAKLRSKLCWMKNHIWLIGFRDSWGAPHSHTKCAQRFREVWRASVWASGVCPSSVKKPWEILRAWSSSAQIYMQMKTTLNRGANPRHAYSALQNHDPHCLEALPYLLQDRDIKTVCRQVQ